MNQEQKITILLYSFLYGTPIIFLAYQKNNHHQEKKKNDISLKKEEKNEVLLSKEKPQESASSFLFWMVLTVIIVFSLVIIFGVVFYQSHQKSEENLEPEENLESEIQSKIASTNKSFSLFSEKNEEEKEEEGKKEEERKKEEEERKKEEELLKNIDDYLGQRPLQCCLFPVGVPGEILGFNIAMTDPQLFEIRKNQTLKVVLQHDMCIEQSFKHLYFFEGQSSGSNIPLVFLGGKINSLAENITKDLLYDVYRESKNNKNYGILTEMAINFIDFVKRAIENNQAIKDDQQITLCSKMLKIENESEATFDDTDRYYCDNENAKKDEHLRLFIEIMKRNDFTFIREYNQDGDQRKHYLFKNCFFVKILFDEISQRLSQFRQEHQNKYK